jgi:hypothetical protein
MTPAPRSVRFQHSATVPLSRRSAIMPRCVPLRVHAHPALLEGLELPAAGAESACPGASFERLLPGHLMPEDAYSVSTAAQWWMVGHETSGDWGPLIRPVEVRVQVDPP